MPDAQGGVLTIIMDDVIVLSSRRNRSAPRSPSGSEERIDKRNAGAHFCPHRSPLMEPGYQIRGAGNYIIPQAERHLIARYGIEEISAPAGVLAAPPENGVSNIDLHLSEGKPVRLQVKPGAHKPMDWVRQVELTLRQDFSFNPRHDSAVTISDGKPIQCSKWSCDS